MNGHTSEPRPDATTAGDEPTTSVVTEFRQTGWEADHLAREGGRLECGRCGRVDAADRFDVGAAHRVEGASDPDELELVLGARCPHCGARGTVVAAFGPTAGALDQDLVAAVDLTDATDPIADPATG